MDEIMEAAEQLSSGLEIQAAVMHVIDGVRHRIILSQQTLDLEDPQIEKYVRRYVNRCRGDMRCAVGAFREDSGFDQNLGAYFRRETNLPAFSGEVLKPVAEYFEREEACSYDVLCVDYRYDDVPYVMFVFLEEQPVVLCTSDASDGFLLNSISFSATSLPSTGRQVASFALVNVLSREILFVDEGKWKDGKSLITDIFLEADGGISKKEVVQTVRQIAYEVAEEFDENPAIMLGKVKNYISETVDEGMSLNTETMVSELFESEPEMAQVFMKKTEEKTLPKEVELPKASVKMSMRRQKIKTDTGIEISFPSSYSGSSEFIEFIRNDDGSYTIEIRGIGKIDNQI